MTQSNGSRISEKPGVTIIADRSDEARLHGAGPNEPSQAEKESSGPLESPPKLTAIVVNRNTAALLIDCVGHMYGSMLDRKPEIILVDNGSTDDSVERVKENYPEVIIIEAGRNLGFGAAVNRAAERASGDFFLLVNTDAMLEPGCAAMLLRLMRARPDAGMAGPQLLNEDGSLQTSFEAAPTLATECLNRSLLKRLFPKRYPGKHSGFTEPTKVEALIGAVVMIRREAFEELNGFDEDYFFFLEETDLALRMRKNGRQVLHEPRARAFHLQGATAKENEAAARIEFYRSRYLFFEKQYGRVASLLLRTAMFVNLSVNVLALGLVSLLTAGTAPNMTHKWRVKSALWRWHAQGLPADQGLPRD